MVICGGYGKIKTNQNLKGAYSAKGAMGQNITIYPAMNVVLAFKTKAAYRRRNSSQIRINLVKKVTELFNGQIN